jgi:hypothetical protein
MFDHRAGLTISNGWFENWDDQPHSRTKLKI